MNTFKKQQKIVKQIHNEFDTAQDRIILEVNNILKELSIPKVSEIEQKAERLTKIGFTSSIVVQQANEIKERNKKLSKTFKITSTIAELFQYYKQTYPTYKFITQEELDRICQKYNLIYTPVSNYKMDIPEKNLQDIEKLIPLKEKDSAENLIELKGLKSLDLIHQLGKDKPIFTQKEIDELLYIYYGRNVPEWTKEAKNTTWLYVINQKINGSGLSERYNYKSVSIIDKSVLFIAAPKKEFNLEDLKEKGSFGFLKIFETEVKDPIVFQYCRGGLIRVITKWGLESSESLLVNEKFN